MRYASTYVVPWHEEWSARIEPIRTDDGLPRALWRLTHRHGPAVLNGAVSARQAYLDLFAGAWLQRRGQTVIVADATWEPGSRRLDQLLRARDVPSAYDMPPISRRLVRRALMSLLDGPTVHYAVLSTDEVQTLPRTWGMDRQRVHFVAFCATREIDLVSPGGGGVFAGGNSMRDYRALVEAAQSINSTVTIATNLNPPLGTRARYGALPAEAYETASLDADIVVVPLLKDTVRSAGQQTYLNAMLRGQPVIVTRSPGVEDYITDGVTGLIVENRPQDLAEAINGLIADPDRARALGQAGRADVLERFQPRHYFDRLLELSESV